MQQCVYSEQLVELMTACMKGLYEIEFFFFLLLIMQLPYRSHRMPLIKEMCCDLGEVII